MVNPPPPALAACRPPTGALRALPALSPAQWVDAMELSSLTPQLPALLAEMGVRYDPDKLAAALADRPAGTR